MSITRNKLISRAVDECMKELYSFVQPSVKWDDFVEQCKIYSNKYKVWKRYNTLKHKEKLLEKEIEEFSIYPTTWENQRIIDCIGPAPYEFYYLPKEIFEDIIDSYIYAYKLDNHQELLDIVNILKGYCKKPIVDKYVDDYTDEYGNHHPGYKSYDHPDNLTTEIIKILIGIDETNICFLDMAEEIQNKCFEFLDMAGNFFSWNQELNSFKTSVYLGASPNSNKENVIKYWKKYRNQDIIIDEKQMKIDYYGEEDLIRKCCWPY